MLKLSTSAWIILLITATFTASIAATVASYYIIPHPARLGIFCAHSSLWTSEVVNDFKGWYQTRYGRSIEVTLIPLDPQSAYEKATKSYVTPEAEIWWGGSLSLFEKALDAFLPYSSIYKGEINATSYSCPLMDLGSSAPRWYAASLYGLGVMYNQRVLQSLNLTVPQTWSDLLKDGYEENITMADPTESEYTLSFIMLIIQSRMFTTQGVQNWTRGWESLIRLSAQIKEYEDNDAYSALKVAAGYVPLAILPDFYAYDKMAAYPPDIGFTYLDSTVLQPDPIAILRRGQNLDEAKAFMDYILTQWAQNIIGKHRLPIRRDATTTSPRINPFAENFPRIPNYNGTFQEIGKLIIKDYYRTWIMERHEAIKTAWKEIREANKTKNANANATCYYNLAWRNFTYAGNYMQRIEIDTIYNKTEGWTLTESVTSYINKWLAISSQAYANATESAKKSRQAVSVKALGSIPELKVFSTGILIYTPPLFKYGEHGWTNLGFKHEGGKTFGCL